MRVRGLVVMIVACQVMDPGSIPGERIFLFSRLLRLELSFSFVVKQAAQEVSPIHAPLLFPSQVLLPVPVLGRGCCVASPSCCVESPPTSPPRPAPTSFSLILRAKRRTKKEIRATGVEPVT